MDITRYMLDKECSRGVVHLLKAGRHMHALQRADILRSPYTMRCMSSTYAVLHACLSPALITVNAARVVSTFMAVTEDAWMLYSGRLQVSIQSLELSHHKIW